MSTMAFRYPTGRPRPTALVLAVLAMSLLLGGCSLVNHELHSTTSSAAHPPNPLTDDQAMAQVVDPAKQIVSVAALQDVTGGFGFTSCNDQGDPPYYGEVEMSFLVPAEVEPDAYFEQVAAAMRAHGWNDGAKPGEHLYGKTLNKDGVTAIIGRADPTYPDRGSVQLIGECRNMTDHHTDGKTIGTNITAQLH